MGDARGSMAAEAALNGALHALAVALLAWLALSTASSLARRVVPGLARFDGLDRLTAPIVRRLLDALLCGVLGAGIVATPAMASTPASHIVDVAVVRAPPAASSVPPPAASSVPPPAASSAPPPAVSARPRQVVVGAGDNLWSIARHEVERRAASPSATVANRDVAAYWGRVIARNRPHLRSGNPNLIFPGEIVELPV